MCYIIFITIIIRKEEIVTKKEYLIKGIPSDFWWKVKAVAVKKKVTVKELIMNLLKKEVEESELDEKKVT